MESSKPFRRREFPINNNGTWPLESLTFSSNVHCRCGAGLAYIEYGQNHHPKSWYCSDWLTGKVPIEDGCMEHIFMLNQDRDNEARAKTKHDCYPFFCWDIKEESQPSANGSSTRRRSDQLVPHVFTLEPSSDDPQSVYGPDHHKWREDNRLCGQCGVHERWHAENQDQIQRSPLNPPEPASETPDSEELPHV